MQAADGGPHRIVAAQAAHGNQGMPVCTPVPGVPVIKILGGRVIEAISVFSPYRHSNSKAEALRPPLRSGAAAGDRAVAAVGVWVAAAGLVINNKRLEFQNDCFHRTRTPAYRRKSNFCEVIILASPKQTDKMTITGLLFFCYTS